MSDPYRGVVELDAEDFAQRPRRRRLMGTGCSGSRSSARCKRTGSRVRGSPVVDAEIDGGRPYVIPTMSMPNAGALVPLLSNDIQTLLKGMLADPAASPTVALEAARVTAASLTAWCDPGAVASALKSLTTPYVKGTHAPH